MALKDWKKKGLNTWVDGHHRLKIIKMRSKHITFLKPYGIIIEYYYEHEVNSERLNDFKTMKEALKFAKSYMRTH